MSTPGSRKLRGYAFDPSLSIRLDTHQINEITYRVPWEDIDYSDGTIRGDYIEIIDYDPTVKQFYEHIDFNAPNVLAENGLDPSESNPMFHQQMVYSVVMTTIKNFERALGRKVQWSTRKLNKKDKKYEEYVGRLRIYPHAMREANAYYSPQKKALLFGYFHSNPADQADQMPGTLVFTCLSHDIIAHETTHAILDGLQRHYNQPTNPDVLAFHEAFADIVALFQHFSFPEVLKHQIAKTRGDLTQQNLLGELAQQFGVAIGHYGSLRGAIGELDDHGNWKPIKPDPNEYHEVMEPHKRGSILVAAIFEAFIAIYERRTEDLYRIATKGTGILPEGHLHPDLVNRLSKEAAKAAKHMLYICIRAIDYCPPVDITFGDYLRALITADRDVVSGDPYAYRLALIEAFKKRGIYPEGINSLSVESLVYPKIKIEGSNSRLMEIISDFLRDYGNKVVYHTNRKNIYDITNAIISGRITNELRNLIGMKPGEKILGLHKRVSIKFDSSDEFIRITGLAFGYDWNRFGIRTSRTYNGMSGPSFSIQNLKLVSRVGPNGKKLNQVVFAIIQRSGVVIKNDTIDRTFIPENIDKLKLKDDEHAYIFQGGCTLIFDLDTRKLKYAISKPLLSFNEGGYYYNLNRKAAVKQWRFQHEGRLHLHSEFHQYFGSTITQLMEPFSLLHQH